MRVRLIIAGILAFSLGASAEAAVNLLAPDTAVASSQFSAGFDGLAVNTINGSGLPLGFFGPGDAHAAYASGNHWTTTTAQPPTSQFITWGFTTPKSLDSIVIWNHQSTTPPAANPGYDVTLFDLTLFDSANAPLLTMNDVALAPDTATGQVFGFGGFVNGVSSVRLDIEAVQSSQDFTGLAEVRFGVPEPGAILPIALGAAGLVGGAGRRRR